MIRLSDEEFAYIVQYVAEKYGINLEKKRVLIECRMSKELEKYHAGTFSEYMVMLKKDQTGKMAEEMIHRLSTHYTYFLRESEHFEAVQNLILPSFSAEILETGLNIWCAGCSSGEECYTLAMALEEYMRERHIKLFYRILATDLSENVLDTGRLGVYEKESGEKLPKKWRDRYTEVLPDGRIKMSKTLREKIWFRSRNLMDEVPGTGIYDLVLCRNVMIYFDPDSRNRLILRLVESLKKGGYLLVGHSELLPVAYKELECVGPAVYRKKY